MKKALLLPLVCLPLAAAPAPEITFESLSIAYPVPEALQDRAFPNYETLSVHLQTENLPLSRSMRREVYIENLQLKDARGNDLKPEFDNDSAGHMQEITITSRQSPQGNCVYISGTAYVYIWEETTTLPALQPDWEKGCTLSQNGMQIRCFTGKPDHPYLNKKWVPTPSYRIEITAPKNKLNPVYEVIPLKADGTPLIEGEYYVNEDARHGSYTFKLISPTRPELIQLSVAADTRRYCIPFRMRLGLPGRLNIPAPGKR